MIHFEPQRNNIMNSCKKRATVIETIPVEKKQRTETIDSDSLAPLHQAAIPVSTFLDVNDCVPVALISDKHQRSPALNDPNNKRQKIMISATIRKQKNEDSCPIYKLSNDELMHIIGYVGEKQYGFVAGVSKRFYEVYLDTYEGETSTSMENAVASVSCAAMCLIHLEEAGFDHRSFYCDVASLFNTAAKEEKLKILKFGEASGYKLNDILNESGIAHSAENGHLEVVQYLRQLGVEWDFLTCSFAAENGHLELLKWARANDCEWNSWTCHRAARNGHLELLIWARENGCPWDFRTCSSAAYNGHLELLQWCMANGCEWDFRTSANAANSGHLKLLKWCRANQCPWDEETCANAAYNGHLELLQWARASLCPWDEETCSFAAMNGHFELLKYARANQCPWDENTCAYAAKNGHLELLKWCRANQCPWDKNTCTNAAENGHLELLKWARLNGCPSDENTYESAL